MNTKDRELLEMAAKAVELEGFEWVSDPFFDGLERRNFDDDGSELQSQTWNPLVNDGDAFRLAVKMRISVHLWRDDVAAVYAKTVREWAEPYGANDCAATRRAIVRAVAEIGRGMA